MPGREGSCRLSEVLGTVKAFRSGIQRDFEFHREKIGRRRLYGCGLGAHQARAQGFFDGAGQGPFAHPA